VKYLSVCSGIEAATVAWRPLGWEAFAYSEIEKFPCKVLAHHYPNTPNLGDMTKYQEWPDAAIDVLVGGTPCQSFSIAGLRKGLDDPRGNLMLTFGAIANKYRPTWLVWENVPGVLSSNKGKDFGAFLGMLGELGYGFAYRVLDAQHFGVAQRRRRVFVVGCLGDWRSAAAVLFERNSMSGNPAPSREDEEKFAEYVKGGIRKNINTKKYNRLNAYPINTQIATRGGAIGKSTGFGIGNNGDPAFTLQENHHHAIAFTARDYGNDATLNLTPTMRSLSCSNGHQSGSHGLAVSIKNIVRRLTPIECERLQGFPDDYTLIDQNTPDGPRYKALGNSMAVPVMRWIGERIDAVEAIQKGQVSA
jgi:DNA (cytosine-5)-methyltransferase 1